MSFRHLITVAPIRYILRCIYIHSYVVLCFVCFVMVTQAFLDLCGTFTIPSQWTRDAIIASVLHQNNVAISFWPNNDVIIAPCVLWEGCFFNTVVIMWLPQYQRSNPGIGGYIRPVPKHDKHNKLGSKRPYKSPNLMKTRSREIRCFNDHIALKFDWHFGSPAAEVPVKFQSDSRYSTGSCGETSVRLVNRCHAYDLEDIQQCPKHFY